MVIVARFVLYDLCSTNSIIKINYETFQRISFSFILFNAEY